MTDPEMIAVYREFMDGKTESQIATIRYNRARSTDKGSMAYFVAFLAKEYQVPKTSAWAIYKCDFYKTWIGDLPND
jgi:hypothetical protein